MFTKELSLLLGLRTGPFHSGRFFFILSPMKVFLPLFGLLVLSAACSPVDLREAPPSGLPEFSGLTELAAFIAANEAQVPHLKPGTEKQIVFADPAAPARTPWALVVLPGFTATRGETAPGPERLAARLGANLFQTRFAGHGLSENALKGVTLQDWMRDAREALAVGRLLGERVAILGTSTGASAGLWLTRQNPAPEALVLISPNLGPKNQSAEMVLWPFGDLLIRLLVGEERVWEPHNDLQAYYWSWRSDAQSLLPMMGLVEVTRRLPAESLTQPLLIFASAEDEVVRPELSRAFFERWGGAVKDWVWVENPGDPSHHVLAGDILSPGYTSTFVEKAAAFLTALP